MYNMVNVYAYSAAAIASDILHNHGMRAEKCVKTEDVDELWSATCQMHKLAIYAVATSDWV